MDSVDLPLLVIALSLTLTWWAYFRKHVTIRVADKTKELTMVGYPTAPSNLRGWSPRGCLREEYRHHLIDDAGDKWIVSQEAYDRARIGRTITLRLWIDEWRPVAFPRHFRFTSSRPR